MTTKTITAMALNAALLTVAAGCGSSSMSASDANTGEPEPVAVTGYTMTMETAPEANPVVIDNYIASVCGIPEPTFAFDKAKVKDQAETPLKELAFCLSNGALAGHDVLLVGHADPRGTVEYNLGLGHERAASVADYLTDHGVSDDKVRMSSLGEAQADGYNKKTWADDRRVEVLLPGG